MASVVARPDPLSAVSKASKANPSDRSGEAKKKCLLPHINPSHEGNLVTLRTDAHSSSVTNSFLPVELLLSLKRHDQEVQGSPPGGTKIPSQSPGERGIRGVKPPPASVWTHANRRGKLKHLVKAPPCVCGAGKDISFLYDTVSSREQTTETKVRL